jgi:hypothetical protein
LEGDRSHQAGGRVRRSHADLVLTLEQLRGQEGAFAAAFADGDLEATTGEA